MTLGFEATILSTYLAQMLIHGSKEIISFVWTYNTELKELKETLENGLLKLENTLEDIIKMSNPIQCGILFSSEWLEEIEKLWYEMYDLKDEPKNHYSKYLTTCLKSFIGKIAKMQKTLEKKRRTMESITENQDESSSGQSAREQELPSQRRQNLWVGDKNAIIQKLKEAGSLGVTIVGICGSGKTKLAHAVAADESITDHFPCIIPVPAPLSPNYNYKFSYDSVMKRIKEKLPHHKSNRVLILLDGLQEVDSTDWVSFCEFCKGNLRPGSKVLVTTQNPQIAHATGTYKYLLAKLSDDECFTMILDVAGTNRNLSVLDRKAITEFKDALVKKCLGLPVIAHRVGALLAAAGPEERQAAILQIIQQDLWKWEKFESVLGTMALVSLLQKKPFLKWCLNYCSLFPPDTEFNKDLLLQLWMAEGLIPNSKEEENFEYLLSHSIFQSSDNNPPYEMHQLAYDFAQNVKYGAFYRQDIGESSHSPSTGITDITRHFSLSCDNIIGNGKEPAVEDALAVIRKKCKNLRTFLLVQPAGELISENPTFFQSLTRLRVLDLSHTKLKTLSPNTFAQLGYLCYLDLSSTPITDVPSLTKNQSLQVLKLNGCKKLRTLPKDFAKLTNLLYFQVNIVNNLGGMPPKMGELKKLRGLEVFLVGKTETGDGHGIEQLMELNELTEPLKITRLENVKCGAEAQKAKLQQKSQLKTLKLEWSADSTHAEAKEVLEGLKPPLTLTELRIINYSGSEFPEWLREPNERPRLNTIYLDNCKGFSDLSLLGDLPLLQHIHLKGMKGIATLPALPSSLKSLTIDKCSDALKQHCLDVGAPWREIKDLLVKIDGDTVLHESSCTQIGDLPAVNDSDSRTLHEDRRRAPSLMPMDASRSVRQPLDSSNDEHDSNGQNFESGRQHPFMETAGSQNKGKQEVDEGTSSSQVPHRANRHRDENYSGNKTDVHISHLEASLNLSKDFNFCG